MKHEAREEREDVEDAARQLVDAGLKVHRALGPGLLESVYEHCLAYELQRGGLRVRRQVPQPILYDGVTLEAGFRLDLVVNDAIVVEIKSVETLSRLFEAQFSPICASPACVLAS